MRVSAYSLYLMLFYNRPPRSSTTATEMSNTISNHVHTNIIHTFFSLMAKYFQQSSLDVIEDSYYVFYLQFSYVKGGQAYDNVYMSDTVLLTSVCMLENRCVGYLRDCKL